LDININNISKSFGEKRVLRDFSANIHKGKINCIMGPSGCGKTTLLNILMGFLEPDSGTVTGVPEKKSAVFQEDRLVESFSAVSNVRMVCGKDVSVDTVKQHLVLIGIEEKSMHVPVSQLSGGMKRRVAIVRAILADSEIIFMDEPFKGLDTGTKHTVIEYVKSNTTGKTVVVVTHYAEEVQMLEGSLIRMEMAQDNLA